MVLTPNVPPRPTRNLSARAQDLNSRLGETIDTFRRQFPDTTDSDVRNALQSAAGSRGGAQRAAGFVAAALGGLVMAGVAVVAMRGGVPADVEVPWAAVAGAAAAIVAVVAVLFNRSGNG